MKTAAPRATTTLAVATFASYVLLVVAGQAGRADLIAGFVPARVGGPALSGALPVWLTPLSATLIHGGLIHLGFNLLMLVYCGRQDEVALGAGGTVALYAIGAYAAAAAHYASDPAGTYPMIGASGAISALVGAYAMLYGSRAPSRFPPEVARWLHMAWLAIAWIAIQLMLGLVSRTQNVAIAAFAHIGGFIAGVLLARPLLRWRYRKA